MLRKWYRKLVGKEKSTKAPNRLERTQAVPLRLESLEERTLLSGTPSYYKQVFDATLAANQATLNSIVKSGDSAQYYNMQYALDATISMYEATKDTSYLKQALSWADTMVSKATIIDNQGYANWSGTWHSPFSATPISLELNEIQGSVELSRLARLILTTPSLNAVYGPQAWTIFNFVKTDIVDKDIFARDNAAYPPKGQLFSDTNALLMRMLQDIVAVEPGAYATTTNWQALYTTKPSGNGPYKISYSQLLQAWENEFQSRFSADGGGLIWDKGLSWYNRGYTAIDTSHANRYPDMVTYTYNVGNAFSLADIQGMGTLLTKVMWNGSFASPEFTNFIDGSNKTFYNYPAKAPTSSAPRPPWNNGLIYSGWVTLGQYDPQVQKVADAVLSAIMAGVRNPSLDDNASFWGLMELAAHLDKNAVLSSQAQAVISVTGASATYDGNSHAASGTASGVGSPAPNLTSELHLLYSRDGINFSTSAPVNAGTYEVYYTFDGDTKYQAVSSRTDSGKTVRISPAKPAVTVTDASGTYNGKAFTASGSAVGVNGTTAVAGTWSFTYYSGSGTSGTKLSGPPTAKGMYTVVGAFTSNDPNYSNGQTQKTFTIS
jgi:hypothetical protein